MAEVTNGLQPEHTPRLMIHEWDEVCRKEIDKLFDISEDDEQGGVNGGVDIEIVATAKGSKPILFLSTPLLHRLRVIDQYPGCTAGRIYRHSPH